MLLVADVLLHGVCLFCFFHALGLLDALSTGLKDAVHLGAQGQHILQLGTLLTHPLSCPAPSCLPCCGTGGLLGSLKCRRGLHAWPCLGTHPRPLDLRF